MTHRKPDRWRVIVQDFTTESYVGGWKVTGYKVSVADMSREGGGHWTEFADFPVYLDRGAVNAPDTTPFYTMKTVAQRFALDLDHELNERS